MRSWLVEGEGLPPATAAKMYDLLGGSPWELWQVREAVREGRAVDDAINELIAVERAKVLEILDQCSDEEFELFVSIVRAIATEGVYLRTIREGAVFTSLLKKMIAHDIWFYDVQTQEITANSESIRQALKKLLPRLEAE